MKRIACAFLFGVTVFLMLIGCVSAKEEMPAEKPGLAVVASPQRYTLYPLVPRFGDVVGLTNATGYTLTSFDLFNATMLEAQPDTENLLTSELEDGQSVLIALSGHPTLKQQLLQESAEVFVYNAYDWEGDLYWGSFDPEKDAWNIVLTLDQLDQEASLEDIPSFGPTIVVANHTDAVLQSLYIGHVPPQQMDGSQTNLLGTQSLDANKEARIAVADLPELAEDLVFDAYATLYVTAFDREGNRYMKLWHPTTDRWAVALDYEALSYPGEGQYPLTIANETGRTLWYLYALSEAAYQAGSYAGDLLGLDLLGEGEETTVDLANLEDLAQALRGDADEAVHIVGLDSDGATYHRLYRPREGTTYLVLGSEDLVGVPQEGGPTLLVRNETGEDLWFLYVSSVELTEPEQGGKDMLGDAIWENGTLFSFSLPPIESETVMYLYAYDLYDTVYHKTWKLSDGWDVTFREEDVSF
jgi:hypothetical protein